MEQIWHKRRKRSVTERKAEMVSTGKFIYHICHKCIRCMKLHLDDIDGREIGWGI